ncbi:hypothetical protein SAMN05216302_10155 [Nitrosomonas aestuarii]|uniref:Uncharacterized protein n=1 Tax=Nitrosomonas aestuarii TaxID=52441 RepID=A0A1I4C9D0_9PROT|nr:hypothetical protein [Nitrosomonas aestuarii]SFK77535.1 hypothetical protein SAMN05216302_10155 [Nitrosomonas aestuarii]
MEAYEIVQIIKFSLFAILTVGSAWLVKRATPEKRIHWFFGCSILNVIMFGTYGPIAIIAILGILALTKKEEDYPLADVGSGALAIFAFVIGGSFHVFSLFMIVGGFYWIWLAIQMESFSMFLVGVFPLTFFVTAPVGAYSLIFETPQWVTDWFLNM